MGKLIQLCLGMAMIPFVHAQSATNFDTKVLIPEGGTAPKDEKPAIVAAKEPGPAATTPSRYISPADLQSYLDAQTSVFLSRGRARDPFAQMQDPEAKPIVKKSTPTSPKRQTQVQVTPFSEIVRLVRANAVRPGEKMFLLGNRQVRVGQTLSLRFRNKPVRALVTDVTSQAISFRNPDTGETGESKLEVLPVGMTPGGKGGITAPGMIRDNADSPIDLEPAEMDMGQPPP